MGGTESSVDVLGGYGGVLYRRPLLPSVEYMRKELDRYPTAYYNDDEFLAAMAASQGTERMVVPSTQWMWHQDTDLQAGETGLSKDPEQVSRQNAILAYIVQLGLFEEKEIQPGATYNDWNRVYAASTRGSEGGKSQSSRLGAAW